MLTKSRATSTLLLGVVLASAPRPAAAQVVAGRVIERGTGHPLGGAFVVLVDSAGAQQAGVLTDSTGAFYLSATRAGRYTLRAEMIGHANVESPPLSLAAGQSMSYTLEAEVYAIPLAGLEVRGEQRCRLRPEAGAATARLWEEARKALTVTAWAQARTTLYFRVAKYRRRLDPQRLFVVQESRTIHAGWGMGSPFRSEAVQTLAERGYMRRSPGGDSLTYSAPDADVLLSDAFADQHCFRVQTAGAPQRGWIGLAFEPIHRDHVDVSGVLWLDAATAELRTLNFHYANLPWDVDRAAQGGFIAFMRVPTGPWIVQRWWIRMPWMEEAHVRLFGIESRRTFVLTNVEEEGGEVLEVRTSSGRTLLQRAETPSND